MRKVNNKMAGQVNNIKGAFSNSKRSDARYRAKGRILPRLSTAVGHDSTTHCDQVNTNITTQYQITVHEAAEEED